MATHLVSSINGYQVTGEVPGRSRDRLRTAGLTFQAKDGYVVLAGVRPEERWRALWSLIGRDDLADDPEYLGKSEDGDFYFHNVIPAIENWSRNLSKWRVCDQLSEIGFSMGVAQSVADLDKCPHLEARQMFVETGDTLSGRFRSLKTPVRLTGCVEPASNTPPELGEHNQEILCGIGGLTSQELAELGEGGWV